jgi:two-component system sensor histidine kinase MtrB
MSVAAVGLAAAWLLLRRRERQARAQVLATLTHELRTPATSLGLALETLRHDFDRLPDTSQDAFLRIAADVRRLKRVIAGSSSYLRLAGPRGRGRFEPRAVESLAAFVEATLEPFADKLEAVTLPPAAAFRTDPYWLSVCIVNVVDNALRHGKPPVTVRCRLDGRRFEMRVQDAGTLARAPSRGASAGLGLGLGIVRRTLADLGGRLGVERDPTVFVISVKESR